MVAESRATSDQNRCFEWAVVSGPIFDGLATESETAVRIAAEADDYTEARADFEAESADRVDAAEAVDPKREQERAVAIVDMVKNVVRNRRNFMRPAFRHFLAT